MDKKECKRMLHMTHEADEKKFDEFVGKQQQWKTEKDSNTINTINFAKDEPPLPTRADICTEMFQYAKNLNSIV